jgi:acetate---CoA ligase (ADP-forming)
MINPSSAERQYPRPAATSAPPLTPPPPARSNDVAAGGRGPAGPGGAAGVRGGDERTTVAAMLEARSVALVGASPRDGSLGQRMITEMARSSPAPATYLVNPRHTEIAGTRCYASLADLPEPVDLVLLAVPDTALEEQLRLSAARGDRSAVIFGSAFDPPGPRPAGQPSLRDRLAATARAAGMAVCGAGCMGFVNVTRGLRAVGYLEPDPLPRGPVALITHSGSVFSAMLRTRRRLGYTVAVSSGQELVTSAAEYAAWALSQTETQVLALVLEAVRDASRLRAVLAQAARRDIPVVLLTAGRSARGRAMVSAHSGALAAADGGWEALARGYGVHRVGDLAELADTLELFAIGRRVRGGTGIATVHDSGLERAHVADVADELGVPFAAIGQPTTARLAGLLDPGLEPANPLDIWGTGARAGEQLAGALTALAGDPAVAGVALAVDLVHEYDGDQSYPDAVTAAARQTSKPVVVLSNLPAAIDPDVAARLRAAGIPVLEGTRTGLLALGHLLDHGVASPAPASDAPPVDQARRARWAAVLTAGAARGAVLADLLRDYGIAVARTCAASSEEEALAAAAELGYPVVLKTDEPGIEHKSDVGGVVLGLARPAELIAAYRDLAERLGRRVLVGETVPAGPELSLGLARDHELGPLLVVGAGGVLVELLADRVVALPPAGPEQAGQLVGQLRMANLLAGVRGQPAADLAAVTAAITGLSQLAVELGDVLEALDINPLICGPHGAVAVDALAIPRQGTHQP